MEEKVNCFRFERLRWEYVLTAPIFTVAVYLYFCARNIKELSVPFIIVSAAVLFLLSVISYFAVYLIIRRGFTAMLFCLFCWIGCYTEPLIWKLLHIICPSLKTAFGFGKLYERHVQLIFNISFVLTIAILLTIPAHKMKEKKTCARLVLAVSLILFGMNGVSILFSTFSVIKDNDDFEIKTEFVKEDSLASPNIYWIHPDGMLGFDAFEKYYGDPQKALTETLTDRGFEISRSAGFEAANSTSVAIPILTSPHAYDTWISQYTMSSEEALEKASDYNFGLRMRLLRQKAELQKAFFDAGYTVNTIGSKDFYYPPVGGYSWPVESDRKRVWKYGQKTDKLFSIQAMLENIENISIYFSACSAKINMLMVRNAAYYDNVSEYRAYMPDEKAREVILNAYQNVDSIYTQDVLGLYDVLNGKYNSPRLTIIHNLIAHSPWQFNEDGSVYEANLDISGYYAQHIYSGKVVTGMVDMIIETDPDAVIIIQADHGIKSNAEDFIQAFGEDADTVELWNSTISAVRIPEQYRNGEEHYMMETPLNIARYLVNNFVGRNYEYLAGE